MKVLIIGNWRPVNMLLAWRRQNQSQVEKKIFLLRQAMLVFSKWKQSGKTSNIVWPDIDALVAFCQKRSHWSNHRWPWAPLVNRVVDGVWKEGLASLANRCPQHNWKALKQLSPKTSLATGPQHSNSGIRQLHWSRPCCGLILNSKGGASLSKGWMACRW